MLKFNVRKQTIKRVDSEKPVNKSVNFLSARFSFDDTWKNYNKYIIFNVNKKHNFLIKLKNINEDILIPWECLQDDGFFISIFGVKDDKNYSLITTNNLFVQLNKAGYVEDFDSTKNPSKDVFTDIYHELEERFDNVTSDDGVLTFYSEGKIIKKINIEAGSEVDPIFNKSASVNIKYSDITSWNSKIDSGDLEEEYLDLESYILG